MQGPADRFDAVAQRANRRARATTAAIAGVATAAVVAGATAALSGTSPITQPDSGHIATEPPTPSETLRYEPSGPPLPGETTVTDLNDPVAVTATGTSTVALGPRPRGATAANVSVVCLTSGRIVYPNGASAVCDEPASESEIADPRSANYGLIDLDPGQTTLTCQAKPDVKRKVVATYVRTETSEGGVNAKGETFGIQRNGKSPDLLAVVTDDGQRGYAYVKDLDGRWPVPTSPGDALAQQEANEGEKRSVPVYESDGETLIGEYTSG